MLRQNVCSIDVQIYWRVDKICFNLYDKKQKQIMVGGLNLYNKKQN